MPNRRNKRRSKFSGRKYSKRGNIGLAISILSIGCLIAAIYAAYAMQGSAGLLIGSMGVLSFVINVVGLVLEIIALTEEDVYKMIPAVGLMISAIGVVSWVGIYMMGMFNYG